MKVLLVQIAPSSEICGAKVSVHSVYGAKGGYWSEINWSHSQSEERGFCLHAEWEGEEEFPLVDSAHAKTNSLFLLLLV